MSRRPAPCRKGFNPMAPRSVARVHPHRGEAISTQAIATAFRAACPPAGLDQKENVAPSIGPLKLRSWVGLSDFISYLR